MIAKIATGGVDDATTDNGKNAAVVALAGKACAAGSLHEKNSQKGFCKSLDRNKKITFA